MSDDWGILSQPANVVAPRLLGCYLVRDLDGIQLAGRIIETEAYDQTDAASHTYRGRTERNHAMFGPSGHLYVYFTYGMHYCCNVVAGPEGYGSGVLIRAVEPLEGIAAMVENRHGVTGTNLTNGPGKVCQALQIDRTFNGHDLRQPPVRLSLQPALPDDVIVQTVRVGIKQAKETPWRFYIKDSPYVSKGQRT